MRLIGAGVGGDRRDCVVLCCEEEVLEGGPSFMLLEIRFGLDA